MLLLVPTWRRVYYAQVGGAEHLKQARRKKGEGEKEIAQREAGTQNAPSVGTSMVFPRVIERTTSSRVPSPTKITIE